MPALANQPGFSLTTARLGRNPFVVELPGNPGYPFIYPRKMEVPPVCPVP
jgi:hypothetical protein